MRVLSNCRFVAVFLATVGCLVSMAAPAMGQTTTTLYVHGGTIDINTDSDPAYEVVLSVDIEPHTCEPNPPTSSTVVNVVENMVDVESVTYGSPSDDGYDKTYFDFLGNMYQLDIKLGDPEDFGGEEAGFTNTGTLTGTHPNQALTQHVLLEGTIFPVDEDCTRGEEICHFIVQVTATGPANTTTMMFGPLNGTGVPFYTFCDAPFSNIDTNSQTVTGFTVDDEMPV